MLFVGGNKKDEDERRFCVCLRPYASRSVSVPQHLVQWDAGNPECLLQLVKELIQQYHHYQCQRLRESSRLLFEYDSLLEDPNYGRNMEIYAGRKNSWVGCSSLVLFFISYILSNVF